MSRLFPMGTAVRVAALFAAFLPAGSSITVECDDGSGSWNALTPGNCSRIGRAVEPEMAARP